MTCSLHVWNYRERFLISLNSDEVLEIIADNLHEGGWNLGWVSAIDLEGRTIWIVDALRGGKRFVVRADEKLTAFLELERAICIHLSTEEI